MSASCLHFEHTRSRFHGAEPMGNGDCIGISRGYRTQRMNIPRMISGGMDLIGDVGKVQIFVDSVRSDMIVLPSWRSHEFDGVESVPSITKFCKPYVS